jgi:uncharacterized protein involved in exopolysaccharide biosynthesis
LDGPAKDWQEGPSLSESVWRYKWLVVTAVLIGAVAATAWSSRQPVRYEGVVRVFLDTGEQTADPSRVVRSQAQYFVSPAVLNRVVALNGDRMTRKELEKRLTVEPARDADLITIRVLGDTPQEAATLADTVVRAYREVVAKQANDAARQAVASVTERQRQLESEIATLDGQLRAQPDNPRLKANRDAKTRQLNTLADQSEQARRDTARAARTAETVKEEAALPDERAQPKPLRNAAIGALLALVVAAGLVWWLNGRQPTSGRAWPTPSMPGGGDEARDELGQRAALRLAARRPSGLAMSSNGTPAGNGAASASGIADFDHIATSVQDLFRFLEGPPQQLYEEDLPQLAAEEIVHWFQVDMAVILLRNGEQLHTMGAVGLRATSAGTVDQGVRNLIEEAARSGPRLLDLDELRRLAGTGLASDHVDSFALVPLVRDQVDFGVLLAGRRGGDEQAAPLSDDEVEEITACIRDMVPHLWAWLLLRSLKLRLGTLQ